MGLPLQHEPVWLPIILCVFLPAFPSWIKPSCLTQRGTGGILGTHMYALDLLLYEPHFLQLNDCLSTRSDSDISFPLSWLPYTKIQSPPLNFLAGKGSCSCWKLQGMLEVFHGIKNLGICFAHGWSLILRISHMHPGSGLPSSHAYYNKYFRWMKAYKRHDSNVPFFCIFHRGFEAIFIALIGRFGIFSGKGGKRKNRA